MKFEPVGVVLGAFLLLCAATVHAQVTRRVPSQYKTIQSAIDASGTGDTVRVAPGTYYENLSILKSITVMSDAGPHVTVIDASSSGQVVIMLTGTLDGFTVRGGVSGLCFPPQGTAFGGGICCLGNAVIRNNIIVNNTVGAPYCSAYGGGIGTLPGSGAAPLIVNNIIAGNSTYSSHSTSLGGGVFSDNGTLINNTICGNTAGGATQYIGSGGGVYGGVNVVCINCVISGNSAPTGPEASGSVSLQTCWTSPNPRLMDSARGDFHLRFDSPCRDAGTNDPRLPAFDNEGDPRIAGSKPDIGADEFYTHLYLTGDARAGGLIHVKLMGNPGLNTVWAYSLHPTLLNPPANFPGLGLFYLGNPIFPLATGTVPSTGVIILPIPIPKQLPTPINIPMQALIGLQLSNPYVTTFR
jgi:hypothetical protein